jgi:hypothetical protein
MKKRNREGKNKKHQSLPLAQLKVEDLDNKPNSSKTNSTYKSPNHIKDSS